MANNAKIPDAHMINKSGKAPVSGVSTNPAKAESAAPLPIIIAPPRPDAVPAKCGRTDNSPAVAFGITSPLPRPTNVIIPKNVKGEPLPERKINRDI